MKLSHDKMVHLSHVLVQALEGLSELEMHQPSNDIRNRLLAVIREELRRDEAAEAKARRKIASQKRAIPEGSPEWEILFRKYYEEELSGQGRA